MDNRLYELGLREYELSEYHKQELEEQGFTVFKDVISPDWLEELQDAFERVYEEEGVEAGKEGAQMEGVRRLPALANKDAAFGQVYLEPFLLSAVSHILKRPFKLHSVNGHAPMKGNPTQALHAQWAGEDRSQAHVVNSMWMLDDFTEANGATRIVPGSHLDPRFVKDVHPDRQSPYLGEVRMAGKAGSVAVFNGNVWHGSCTSYDGKSRRTLHCAFIAREHPQQTDQRVYLRKDTAARLSPLARYVLDVD